jgi:hypothetical protein
MLNPSKAGVDVDDPTIRKCVGFARRSRHGGIVVVNLFAWRAVKSRDLQMAADPVGGENDSHILWACAASSRMTLVAAWGSERFARARVSAVRRLLAASGRAICCYRKTRGGHPCHPLYLPYSCRLGPL